MNDPNRLLHDAAPPKPKDGRPGEHVWTMTKDGHTYRAELRDHAPDFGCELQILFDGELKVAHLHPDRQWALTEARLRAEALRLRGWSDT